MRTKLCRALAALPLLVVTQGVSMAQMGDASTVTINQRVTFPEVTLDPGSYTVQLEDRLSDRALVRIQSADKSHSYLMLTVPNTQLRKESADHFNYWTDASSGQTFAKGWTCSGCPSALEFVYPKADAVVIAKANGNPVLAVDPPSDKLPASNLSADDLKAVTLWLLTPKRVDGGSDIQLDAARYQAPAQAAPSEQLVARNTQPHESKPARLPHTATYNPAIGLTGFCCLISGLLLPRRAKNQDLELEVGATLD